MQTSKFRQVRVLLAPLCLFSPPEIKYLPVLSLTIVFVSSFTLVLSIRYIFKRHRRRKKEKKESKKVYVLFALSV